MGTLLVARKISEGKIIAKYLERFKLMHMKDLCKGIAENLSGVAEVENDIMRGIGQLDIPAILKAAKKTGIQYYYIEFL